MSLGKNAPDPNDVFVLQEGETKVLYEKDTKMRRTGTFILHKEDHTLGNIVRQYVCFRKKRRE
jgi:DNA-directed RNA polymerase II subunit RPB11